MVHWSVTRAVALLVAVLGMLSGAAVVAGAAHATDASLADDEPVGTVQGFLRDLSGALVPGVDVTVTDTEGFSATGTSDDTGKWTVEVPGEGQYEVELNVGTLPDGVAEPTKNPIDVTVFPGSPRTVLFTLGERERNLTNKWEQAAQLTVEGLRFGLIIALAAVGLSMIYGTTGLTNFAHGEIVTFGAIITWWLNVSVGIHLIPAALLGVLLSGAVRIRQQPRVVAARCDGARPG